MKKKIVMSMEERIEGIVDWPFMLCKSQGCKNFL